MTKKIKSSIIAILFIAIMVMTGLSLFTLQPANTVYASTAVFSEENVPAFEKYYIKNAEYLIRDCYVENGTDKVKANVYASFDGGQFAKLTEEQAKKFKVKASSYVDVKYEYNGTYSDVTRIDVVDIGYANTGMNYENYGKLFLNDNATFSANASTYNYVFDGTNATETLKFANPLSLSNFSVQFKIAQENKVALDGFTELEVRIIDFYDPTNVAKCVYADDGAKLTYTVGEKTINCPGEGMDNLNESISYSLKDGVIVNSKRGDVAAAKLPGELCYLEIELKGITGKAGLAINRLCNQSLTKSSSVTRSLLVVENETGHVTENDTYTINPAVAAGVLLPINDGNVTITVKDPSRKVVTAKNGVKLENAPNAAYDFDITALGTYIITYTINRPDGSKDDVPFSLRSVDVVVPTLVFDGDYSKEDFVLNIRPGTMHTIQSYTLTDNLDKSEDIKTHVWITDSIGKILAIDIESYTFTEIGNYKVNVIATDVAGNSSISSYNVSVDADAPATSNGGSGCSSNVSTGGGVLVFVGLVGLSWFVIRKKRTNG